MATLPPSLGRRPGKPLCLASLHGDRLYTARFRLVVRVPRRTHDHPAHFVPRIASAFSTARRHESPEPPAAMFALPRKQPTGASPSCPAGAQNRIFVGFWPSYRFTQDYGITTQSGIHEIKPPLNTIQPILNTVQPSGLTCYRLFDCRHPVLDVADVINTHFLGSNRTVHSWYSPLSQALSRQASCFFASSGLSSIQVRTERVSSRAGSCASIIRQAASQ